MLTPEDHSLIADAVREGMRSDPTPWRAIFFHTLLGIAALAIAIWAFGFLKAWRLPVEVSLSQPSGEDSAGISMSGAAGEVDWRLDLAGRIELEALPQTTFGSGIDTGEIDVVLPVSAGECPGIAAQLGGRCLENVLRIRGIAITFSSPVRIEVVSELPTNVGAASDVPSGSGHFSVRSTDEVVVSIQARQGTVTHLQLPSVYVNLNQVRTPEESPSRSTSVELRLFDELDSYAQFRLRPVSPRPVFAYIDSSTNDLWFEGRAPVIEMHQFSGVVTTSTGGREVVEPPAHLVLTGGRDTPELVLFGGRRRSAISVDPGRVSSVLVDREELVPSVWDRYSAIVVPIWGAFFGLVVVSQLATALRGVWSRSDLKLRTASSSPSTPRSQREADPTDSR